MSCAACQCVDCGCTSLDRRIISVRGGTGGGRLRIQRSPRNEDNCIVSRLLCSPVKQCWTNALLTTCCRKESLRTESEAHHAELRHAASCCQLGCSRLCVPPARTFTPLGPGQWVRPDPLL